MTSLITQECENESIRVHSVKTLSSLPLPVGPLDPAYAAVEDRILAKCSSPIDSRLGKPEHLHLLAIREQLRDRTKHTPPAQLSTTAWGPPTTWTDFTSKAVSCSGFAGLMDMNSNDRAAHGVHSSGSSTEHLLRPSFI